MTIQNMICMLFYVLSEFNFMAFDGEFIDGYKNNPR